MAPPAKPRSRGAKPGSGSRPRGAGPGPKSRGRDCRVGAAGPEHGARHSFLWPSPSPLPSALGRPVARPRPCRLALRATLHHQPGPPPRRLTWPCQRPTPQPKLPPPACLVPCGHFCPAHPAMLPTPAMLAMLMLYVIGRQGGGRVCLVMHPCAPLPLLCLPWLPCPAPSGPAPAQRPGWPPPRRRPPAPCRPWGVPLFTAPEGNPETGTPFPPIVNARSGPDLHIFA